MKVLRMSQYNWLVLLWQDGVRKRFPSSRIQFQASKKKKEKFSPSALATFQCCIAEHSASDASKL
jgi:hypothetical protein